MLQASHILYTSFESIPLRKLKVILQLLPLIRWNEHVNAANNYAKNFLLKQLFRSKSIYLKTTPEQRVDLYMHELDWIQEFSTTFPIKSYKLKGLTFYAPDDMLTDITIDQLMEADVALHRFIRSEKNNYLGHFLAMLYTTDSDYQSDETLEMNASILLTIPESEKIAIIRAFIGSFQALRKACPTLFPVEIARSEERATKQPVSEKIADPAKAWRELLFELANTPGFPGMDKAKSALAWEALTYMDHEQDKIRREKDRLKSSAR